MEFHKVRTNVLVLAGMVCFIALGMMGGMFWFLNQFDLAPESFWTGAVVGSMVTLFITIIGVAIGGLVSTMSQVAEDPAPPVVPADLHSQALYLFSDYMRAHASMIAESADHVDALGKPVPDSRSG